MKCHSPSFGCRYQKLNIQSLWFSGPDCVVFSYLTTSHTCRGINQAVAVAEMVTAMVMVAVMMAVVVVVLMVVCV